MAQEFNISVTPLGDNDYLVRTERVASGVPLAEEQIIWPIERWLSDSRQLMNDPLLRVLQGITNPPVISKPYSPPLVDLGQELYNALFQRSLRDSWMMAQAVAQSQNMVLRLRLGLKDTKLKSIPWEVLHAGDRPLTTGTDISFSRYQIGSIKNQTYHPSSNGKEPAPLKILMAIAAPTDQDALAVQQEVKHIESELRFRQDRQLPPIEITVLTQPGREELTQAIEQEDYQVFHYAGHSNQGGSGGNLYLVNGKTGLTEMFSGEDLAGLLVNNGIQMAIFNSCRGAYNGAITGDNNESNAEGNLAQALIKRGIPSILAMAEKIPDNVALTLSRLFYRNLNSAYPIDLSLNRARQGLISAYGSHNLYWALPILYLHPDFDGYLTTGHQAHGKLQLNPLEEQSEPSEPDNKILLNTQQDNEYPLSEEEEKYLSSLITDQEDPQTYEEDSAFVSDLLQQLSAGLNGKTLNSNSDSSKPESNPKAIINIAKPAITITDSVPTPPGKKTIPLKTILGISISIISIATIIIGLWWYRQKTPLPADLLTPIKSTPTNTNSNPNLPQTSTADLTNIAINAFTEKNMTTGEQAVEELLNRNTVQAAISALSSLPPAEKDTPEINFLWGRIAWQSIQTKNQQYSIDDARRYWERAVDQQPNNPKYLNALGFAYYTEGQTDRAVSTWLKAIDLLEELSKTQAQPPKEILKAYAGLALTIYRSAQNETPEKKQKLINEAIQIRRQIITQDPINFLPKELSKNWLWSESAIKDWQQILQL